MSAASGAASLLGWTPYRAAWLGDRLMVDWCHLDRMRFSDPFFDDTIAKAMRLPFNLVFAQRTPIAALAALPSGLKPSGFIFHMARCGSTLCAQALAADPAHIVLSEAAPLRSVLRAPCHGPATPADVEGWLRGMVHALAQPRFGETRLFVKFMAADAFHLPLITRVFPDVPWLFLYRDPVEILASQGVLPGVDALRGQIPPAWLGLTAEAIAPMPAEVYQCHVMAAIGEAALRAETAGRGLILDYRALPEALWGAVATLFGLDLDASDRAAMRAVAARDAKRPHAPFEADSTAKRAAMAPWRSAAEAIVGPTIARLARAAGSRQRPSAAAMP